ncbi:MAG: prepilin-type N-terminal cleavage/methylation domain-containing protein [Elusimicrobia bacterium]|nr:prepilin-type N-terminal cleavage/methylation domain-containing protein [Elusimicrobiota bacterium]
MNVWKRGYTLMEMMLVVGILGVLVLAAPKTFIRTYQFVQLMTARVEIQKNARGALANINRDLRQAVASSITVDAVSGQPPHSRVTFNKYNSSGGIDTVSYYQQGNKLYQATGGVAGKMIANNLRYIAFTYPRTDDDSILSISITFEKATYEGGTKALQMAVEKVRIMN